MRRLLGEPWRAWLALLIGVLAVTAQTASSITMSVLMKAMIDDFGWSRAEFASAATVRLIAMVAIMPFAGQLTDRFGARLVLGGGALLAGACVLATSCVQSLPQFLMISAAMGPAQACIGSVGASALVLRLFTHRRGLAVGILNGGDNLLNAGIPLLAVALLQGRGWRPTLALLGVVYLLLAGLVAIALRSADGREPTPAADLVTPRLRLRDLVARDRRLWIVFGVFCAVYAYITSLQLHFHAFQTDAGQSPATASQLLSIQILVGAVGAPLFGWLSERTSARVALLVCLTGLTLSAATVWNVHAEPWLSAWAVFHGLVNSGVVAILALVLHELTGGAQQIGGLMGVALALCMAATLVGNQWTAWMFDRFHAYELVWQMYTILLVCAVPAAVWLLRARSVRAVVGMVVLTGIAGRVAVASAAESLPPVCATRGAAACVPPSYVAVLSAFPAELEPLLGQMTIAQTIAAGARTFYVGTLAGTRVVLVRTGIGLVNAEATTRTLLARFDVSAIIFSGVAGSGLDIGDVAVPVDWSDGLDVFSVDPALFEVAQHLAVVLADCTPVPPDPPGEVVCLGRSPRVVVGGHGESADPFGSVSFPCTEGGGPVFGCEPLVAGAATPLDATDMETTAVARVAQAAHLPFLGIRGVSDGSGDPLHLGGFPAQFLAYYRLAANNAATVTRAVLSAWAARQPRPFAGMRRKAVLLRGADVGAACDWERAAGPVCSGARTTGSTTRQVARACAAPIDHAWSTVARSVARTKASTLTAACRRALRTTVRSYGFAFSP